MPGRWLRLRTAPPMQAMRRADRHCRLSLSSSARAALALPSGADGMAQPADKLFEARPKNAAELAASEEDVNGIAARNEFPCCVAQERFWLLDRLDPSNSSYHLAVRWRLEGRVATDVLEQAWLKIIERHEVLRTTFREAGGVPIQCVSETAKFRLDEIDLGNLAPEQQQAEADRIGMIEARAPFDDA